MFWAKAPKRVSATGWTVLIAAMVSRAGCAGTKLGNPLPFANDNLTQVSPGDAGAALKLTRAMRQGGDLTPSIQLYRNLVATKSVTGEVVVEFGDVVFEAGSPDDAIDAYSRVGDKSSARLEALLGLTLATMSGMEAMAVTGAEAFKEHSPSNPPAVAMLGPQLGDTDGVARVPVLPNQHNTDVLMVARGDDTHVLPTAHAIEHASIFKHIGTGYRLSSLGVSMRTRGRRVR
jgi:hypothetical protein